MDLTNLTSAHFKQIISLLDKKESLQAQISDLDQKIAGLLGGSGLDGTTRRGPRKASRSSQEPVATAKIGRRKGGGGKRGALKESIINELKNAGDEGVSIKELADKLNVKSANLHAWFGSTGKKIAGLQKVGPARYQLASDKEAEEI
ncbi:MAG: hypothetical protein JO295_12830 [Verrucomicrobia bacterium]|nr:hypothetical protein [Verrucomicrobiota bacterium]